MHSFLSLSGVQTWFFYRFLNELSDSADPSAFPPLWSVSISSSCQHDSFTLSCIKVWWIWYYIGSIMTWSLVAHEWEQEWEKSLVKLQSKVKLNKMSMRFGSCFLPQKGRKRAFPQGMHFLHAGLYQPVLPNSPHISFPFRADWCFSMFFILHKPFCLESEVQGRDPVPVRLVSQALLCMLLRSRSSKRCKTLKLLLQFVLPISWKPLYSCWFVIKVHTVTGWEYWIVIAWPPCLNTPLTHTGLN